jgi:hypothetical protein
MVDNYHNSGHYPSSYILFKNYDVSETELSFRLQFESTQMGPTEIAILCLRWWLLVSGARD